MPEQIGNAGNMAMAWAGRIMLSLPVVPQTQPRGLSKRRVANRNLSPAPATISRAYSDIPMVLPAPADNISLPANIPRREIQARNRVLLAAQDSGKNGDESYPRINLAKIADKVYRLMRSDLILERERTTKMGG